MNLGNTSTLEPCAKHAPGITPAQVVLIDRIARDQLVNANRANCPQACRPVQFHGSGIDRRAAGPVMSFHNSRL